MDYQTLRDELLAGSRLLNPTYSTPKISHLMQTCWLADPNERPTFTKIKAHLQSSCRILSTVPKNEIHQYINLISDNSMHNQYKMIQRCNPMFEQLEDETLNTTELHPKSYSYFESKPSEVTNLSILNYTSDEADIMLNYVNTKSKDEEFEEMEEEEEVPFLGTPFIDDDDDADDDVDNVFTEE